MYDGTVSSISIRYLTMSRCSVGIGFDISLISKLIYHHSKSHANQLNRNNCDEGHWPLTVETFKFKHQIDSCSLMCITI